MFIHFFFTGEHIIRKDIGYEPMEYNAVCMLGKRHVCVSEQWSRTVHIHSMDSGEEVGRNSGDEVRKSKGEEVGRNNPDEVPLENGAAGRLLAVGGGEEMIMGMAEGDFNRINSIRLYKVND